jgi:hypothetical protein
VRIAFKLLLHAVGQVLLVAVALLAISALPILYIEARCRDLPQSMADATPRVIRDLPWRRPEVNSYLSYPEWYIVHAYEDFAGVLKTRDEHAFSYTASILGFWTSLCDITTRTTRQAATPGDMKAMLYIIGVSFTAEMIVKGLWENTIGRASAWWRGPDKNAEDRFASGVADRYAAFLTQTPWYQFPFAATVAQFWRETPFAAASAVRSIERRVALTAEWGVKAGYAVLIAQAAGLSPADLRIRSVVAGIPSADLAAMPGATVVGEAPGGTLIETDRYRAFTDIVRQVVAKGGQFSEIAGNRRVLVTLVIPMKDQFAVPDAQKLFAVLVQARPGWQRIGLDVPVHRIGDAMRAATAEGGSFEHLYDY